MAEEHDFPFQDVDFTSSSLNLAQSTPTTVSKVLDHFQSHSNSITSTTKPKFLDLGSGDGRYVFEAARRGIYSVGIDLDPKLIEDCVKRSIELGLADRCEFVQGDFFDFDLSSFNFISCYLYKKTLSLVAKKLFDRLQCGNCVVATVLYCPPNWIPLFVDDVIKIFIFDGTVKLKLRS